MPELNQELETEQLITKGPDEGAAPEGAESTAQAPTGEADDEIESED